MVNQINNFQTESIKLRFNPKPSTILHIDLNSCFATIEQQANPKLRGKPIAVAAYVSSKGCILAPSIEAKKFGVKTGMRVKDGKILCPHLIILGSDPWKYRHVHLKLRQLLSIYTDNLTPKSIDEFVLNLENSPHFKKGMRELGGEIKKRIKDEIGEWLTVSIGIAPNRYLAKLAAGIHKPDGLDEINEDNFLEVYKNLGLMDLHGIKVKNSVRLNNAGIFTVLDFYHSPIWKNKSAFHSVTGFDWYLRLRGFEIDDVQFARRSYGNSFSLPKPYSTVEELSPILQKLVEKMGMRLRKAGYKAQGVHLGIEYRDGDYWHKGVGLSNVIFDSRDIYKYIFKLLVSSPLKKPVRNLAASCFNLVTSKESQLELFDDVERKERLVEAIDDINERWGTFVITPATMLGTDNVVVDRIAFGGVKELEEFTLSNA